LLVNIDFRVADGFNGLEKIANPLVSADATQSARLEQTLHQLGLSRLNDHQRLRPWIIVAEMSKSSVRKQSASTTSASQAIALPEAEREDET
jgi:hypothetical protein